MVEMDFEAFSEGFFKGLGFLSVTNNLNQL